eukprot:TRINITY_DN12612_c0_g1_i1.p1 TRINITY_DN12612_c0_g1~~TRINITY_DN12612_c0_g1_i1.p1  ORF type:complete len:1050 (-),score=160.87 TRINITY_DN12612_c0_g1_i1:56-3205(-)
MTSSFYGGAVDSLTAIAIQLAGIGDDVHGGQIALTMAEPNDNKFARTIALICCGVPMSILGILGTCILVGPRLGMSLSTLLRLKCFVFIMMHLFEYGCNLALIYILWEQRATWSFYLLCVVNITVGVLCVLTSFSSTDWEKWPCNPIVSVVFLVVVMGMMQFIHVKLAFDDYQAMRFRSIEEADGEVPVPAMMPARFQCKGIDGLVEGFVFGSVALYAYIKQDWVSALDIRLVQQPVVVCSGIFSFISVGLAAMEVDHRTSASVQRAMNASPLNKVRHLIFRLSETMTRLFTVVILLAATRGMRYWWMLIVALFFDGVFGLLIVRFRGGRDPVRQAAWLVALGTFCVNLWQFVDAPGLSLQSRRISKVIVPFRIVQVLAVVIIVAFANSEELTTVRDVFLTERRDVAITWLACIFIYLVSLKTYAMKIQPEADLHVVVADGETDFLRNLLRGSELVLDVNRYGPDGRTPLHLAAVMGNLDCVELLVEEKANLLARTRDANADTALHLAVGKNHAAVARFLCHASSQSTTASFRPAVNLQNSYGDTALHVAARKHNVEIIRELLKVPSINACVKNHKDQTPAECAPSEEFRFDRNSDESVVMELLQRAEASASASTEIGDYVPPGGLVDPTLELSRIDVGEGAVQGPSPVSSEDKTGQGAGEKKPSETVSQHSIPLMNLDAAQEEEFLTRNGNEVSAKRRQANLLATNCGISSFMLSAGMGAMSKAVMGSIREDSTPVASGEEMSAHSVSFDDFTEVKKLGEGAFGKVLLVKHTASCTFFALKTMDKAKFRAQKITAKAHTEQFILKTTRHPFIVSLHYAFQGTTFWALVMEFCPNGDLQGILGSRGTPGLKPYDAARFGGEILLALAHLHSMHVIFRDLKLENVVISAEFHAKVTDFGFAKKLDHLNDAKTMCGSYGYVAPEIMLNTGKYSYSVDLYSFGVLMFMLLSGGDPRQSNPRERLPPMRPSQLRRRLRETRGATPRPAWASEALGGLELVFMLTSDVAEERTTCNEVKEHRFFRKALGRSVDSLMDDAFAPVSPPEPPSSAST